MDRYGININSYNAESFGCKHTPSFKAKKLSKISELASDKAFAVASASISAISAASIVIIQNHNKPNKEFDHEKLAKEITKKIEQNLTVKEICADLGISISLYCKIVDEFEIMTPRQKARQNSSNINIDEFKKDVQDGVSKSEVLKKYNITSAQYALLLKQTNISSKKMLANDNAASITKEMLEDAILYSNTKAEVCRKLHISNKTYENIKIKFGVTDDPISSHDKWNSLTTDKKIEIIKSGKSIDAICKEYNISPGLIQRFIQSENIKTNTIRRREIREAADIESIQSDINAGIAIAEILEKHNLSSSQFQLLMDSGKITTPQKKARDKVANITKEQFIEAINSSTNITEALNKLSVSKGTLYKLERQFGAQIPWKRIRAKTEFPVDKTTLEKEINAGTPIDEICSKYKISQYMYYKMMQVYNIESSNLNLDEKFRDVDKSALEDIIAQKTTHKEVYEELGLTRKQYAVLLKRRNIKTKHQSDIERISKITKEKLAEAISQGSTISELCKQFNISLGTCYTLLRKYQIEWTPTSDYNKKSLELMHDDELKNKLAELLFSNKDIEHNETLMELIDFVYEIHFDNDTRTNVIPFIRTLQNVQKGYISSKKVLEKDEVQQIKNIKLKIDEATEKLMNLASQEKNTKIRDFCAKYIPTSYADKNNKYVLPIIEIISSNAKNKNLEYVLNYYDSLWSNNPRLQDACNYAKDNNGNIDISKCGQYLFCAKIYDNPAPCRDELIPFLESLHSSDISDNTAIENIGKLLDMLDNYKLEDINFTDFNKYFNINDNAAKNIIKVFVENYYIKNDTHAIATDDKGRKVPVTLSACAKQNIYNKYKYPSCNEVLYLFDEALKHIVGPKGKAGIKLFTNGNITFYRLKIMGYPDRIDALNDDFVFDSYSKYGGHK